MPSNHVVRKTAVGYIVAVKYDGSVAAGPYESVEEADEALRDLKEGAPPKEAKRAVQEGADAPKVTKKKARKKAGKK